MGKITSTTAFTGKVGNLVGYTIDGKNYVRILPETTANPNTLAQRRTRARWALMGKITKLVPIDILTGMGNTNQQRRQRFNAHLVKNISVTGNAANLTASINETSLLFSDGPAILQPTINIAPDTVFEAGTLNLILNPDGSAPIPDDYTSIQYLIIVLFTDTKQLTDLQWAYYTDGELPVFRTDPRNTRADIYLIPVAELANPDAATNYGQPITDGSQTWTLDVTTPTADGALQLWCRSQFIGQVNQGDASIPGIDPIQPIDPQP